MAVLTIIGAGMMGSAMCWPAADNRHEIRLVGTHLDREIVESIRNSGLHPKLLRQVPPGVRAFFHTQIAEALEGAQLVICGVSSFGVDWFAEQAGPLLNPDAPVLAITKGLYAQENGDLQILPDRLEEPLPPSRRGKISWNAVTGPCISHELAARRHTAVYFCGRDPEVLNQLRALLATPYYHISACTDFVGAEVCAAMKNAYAICINLPIGVYERDGADVLAHMYNPQAALFGQSLREMGTLVDLMGGERRALTELAGAADLYVTVFGGRNARLGKMLGQGYSYAAARETLLGETLEGVEIMTRVCRALPKLEARGLVRQDDFPLLTHLSRIIQGESGAEIPWSSFFGDIVLHPNAV